MPKTRLQVIAPVLTNFFHCMHCEQFFQQAGIGEQVHRTDLEQYPEDFLRDAARLAEWLFDLAERYGDRFWIQVIDPQSLQGFFLSLRHRVRSYPSFIVKDWKAHVGWDRAALDRILQENLAHVLGLTELS